MRRILGSLVAVIVLVAPACAAELPNFDAGSAPDPTSTTASGSALPTIPSTTTTTTTEPPLIVPEQLTGLEVAPIAIIDGDNLWNLMVAVADSDATRRRGLMEVADLGDLDGMLFVWEDTVDTGFWMSNVILPLDIAFFGGDLNYVDSFTMPLCLDGDCPTHPPSGQFQYAVEVLETTFVELTPAATLILDPREIAG